MPLDDLWGLPSTPAEFLKSSLTSRLDKIRNTQQHQDDSTLEGIVQGWREGRIDSLPDALIYPLRRDPAQVGRDLEDSSEVDEDLAYEEFSGTCFLWEVENHVGCNVPLLSIGRLDGRSQAVVRVLRELMTCNDLEIFLIQYDPAQSDHGQENRDYLDIMGRPRLLNFNMPHLDTLSSSHRDCDVAIVICRTSNIVENLMVLMDEEQTESYRDQVMCYLIHHAFDQLSPDVLNGVSQSIRHGRVHVGTHVVDKLLICSILLKNWCLFNTEAFAYASEPSVKLFGILNRALEFSGNPVEGFEPGFKKLLNKLSAGRRLLDALLVLETPEQVKQNPDGLVATWINDYFHEIETGTARGAGLLGFREAGAIIRICVQYQDCFNRAKQLHTMFASRVNNGKFCLGLVLHIFAHLEDGSISPRTAQSWYQYFRHHGLAQVRLSDIMSIAEFTKDGVARGKSSHGVDNAGKTPCCQPTQRGEASSMFAYMVQLGWYTEAVEFLTEFVLRKLRLDDPGFNSIILESLWLPFFSEVFSASRRPDNRNWRQIEPVLRDVFLAVLTFYTVCVVGREPGKGSLRRARLSSQCGCVSCQAINTFLVDQTKTRQLFQVIHKNSATRQLARQWETDRSTITVSRPALSHIVRQLDDVDRDCACHLRETKAAGLVLVLQKRDNERRWRAWNERREVAKEKMHELEYLKEILGKQHVAWESLAFLEKASPAELTIPFIMDNVKVEAKTLAGIRQMLREQLALLRQGRGLTWKTIMFSPDGLTIKWL